MTNSEAIVYGGRNFGKTYLEIKRLVEENTKLKAEIQQLNTQIAESNQEGVSISHDILELREENKWLE